MYNPMMKTDAYNLVVIPNGDPDSPNTLADVEIHFTKGPLAGSKLVGGAIRKDPRGGGNFATPPSRAFGVGTERRYFDFLRPITDDFEESKTVRDRVREWFKDGYRNLTKEDTHA